MFGLLLNNFLNVLLKTNSASPHGSLGLVIIQASLLRIELAINSKVTANTYEVSFDFFFLALLNPCWLTTCREFEPNFISSYKLEGFTDLSTCWHLMEDRFLKMSNAWIIMHIKPVFRGFIPENSWKLSLGSLGWNWLLECVIAAEQTNSWPMKPNTFIHFVISRYQLCQEIMKYQQEVAEKIVSLTTAFELTVIEEAASELKDGCIRNKDLLILGVTVLILEQCLKSNFPSTFPK